MAGAIIQTYEIFCHYNPKRGTIREKEKALKRRGKRSSFAWRSIHGSCDVLKEGLIWRVGNGRSVRIWKGRWVPNPSTFKIFSLPTVLDPDVKVCDLVDTDSKWWNFPLLESLFSSDEVEKIKEIPLSSTNQEDVLIWRGNKNGVFSVKSEYHMLKEMESWKIATGSSTRGGSDFWKRLWALPVPNVEKIFLWRACHDILPTRENLHKRKIIEEPSCPVCGLEVESRLHILWSCELTKDV
jgi:hypothetical protein